MHIAINGWFWGNHHAGSGQYLYYLLHNLRKIDKSLELTLILPPHLQNPQDLPENINIVHSGKSGKAGKIGKVLFEQRTFPALAAKSGADLMHVPYWAAPLSASLPIVTSVLDLIPLLYPAYAVGFLNRLYVSLVSASARGSNHILTISHTSAVDIETHLGIPREKITVTYLAPDMRFHPRMGADKDAAVREKYDLPEQFVLYLGSYDMRKQINQLLLAYTYVGEAEGDNIPLVLAGKPPAAWKEPLYPDLEEYARRLNITEYVQWLGFVDEADKDSLYRLADVFVFPSEYEGFGLPPLEAMASGTPVVTSDAVIFEEVLEDGAYITENAREMAGAIIALLLQKPLRDALINQGLAQATKYNWRKTAKTTLTVYEKVLAEG